MKKFIGFFILVIALLMISGCTQPAAVTTPVTTAVQTVPPTVPPTVATSVPTHVPTTEPTTIATPQSTIPITNVTTVVKTPIPVQTASTKITTIYIRNNSFVPQVLTVLPGTGISWINDDATVHAIKATGNHTGMFNSGDFVKGSLVDYSFGADEGTFEFIDTYSNATGMIIVKKGELLSSITTVRPTSTA